MTVTRRKDAANRRTKMQTIKELTSEVMQRSKKFSPGSEYYRSIPESIADMLSEMDQYFDRYDQIDQTIRTKSEVERELRKLIGRPKNYIVVAAYDGPFGDRGTIISRHRSQELAEHAAKRRDPSGGWLKIENAKERQK